jgi:hypothetical protein
MGCRDLLSRKRHESDDRELATPYYDRVDEYLGISGVKENLPYLPDGHFQRPTRLTSAELAFRNCT